MHNSQLSVSVLICAYTEARWGDLVEAIESLQRQTRPANEIIVVIDHNPTLFLVAQSELQGVRVIESSRAQGLSGARNSGLAVATGDIIAFMDEDAVAAPDWLENLLHHYTDPNVLGVGGAIEPLWQTGRPHWFPQEFDWVVGCTYRGMPQQNATVRNLIGCNMSLRSSLFRQIGGFRHGVGRVGARPVGCEETELCIRARQSCLDGKFIYEPNAQVAHRVPATRANHRYFLSRAYSEGISKALISQFVGSNDALASERIYTQKILPAGVVRGIGDTLRGDLAGLQRSLAIIIGFLATAIGFLRGKATELLQRIPFSHSFADSLLEPSFPGFKPTEILEIELSHALPKIPPTTASGSYQRWLLLIRLHGKPLGMMELKAPVDGLSADEVALQIWRVHATSIQEQLRKSGITLRTRLGAAGIRFNSPVTRMTESPFVSVIVATRDRAESLAVTLDSLLAMEYPNFEILVVDNHPATDSTFRLLRKKYAENPNIRYVREDEPGLAIAHNRGLREVNAPLIAFTDDDVRVDRQWLTRIVQAFGTTENVGCVTGMILPAELQTPAQEWIEQYGGFSKGFERRIFDLETHRAATPLHPYSAGLFGSGANMTFTSEALRAIGGFDAALGAGSKALGGDDLAAFFEVIAHGYRIVYEPAAFLYHAHRRDYAGLRRQAFGYGVGLTAYLTKIVLEDPARILDFLKRMPQGLFYIFSSRSPKNAKKASSYPSELTWVERWGMLYGPIAYLRSRWHLRHRRSNTQWKMTTPPTLMQSNQAGGD